MTGEFLQDVHFDAFISSDLGRAANTAEFIKSKNNFQSTSKSFLTPLVREVCGGIYEGKSLTEIRNFFKQKISEKIDFKKVKPENGECLEDVEIRTIQFFSGLASNVFGLENEKFGLDFEVSENKALMVSHGGWIKGAFELVLGAMGREVQSVLRPNNCSVSVLRMWLVEGDGVGLDIGGSKVGFELEKFGEVAHLED